MSDHTVMIVTNRAKSVIKFKMAVNVIFNTIKDTG